MRVLYYPDNRQNPYQALYARALGEYGLEVVPGEHYSDGYLKAQRGKAGAVHLHWLENLIGSRGLRGVWGLRQFCRCARRMGMRVIWTVHNHRPHRSATLADDLAAKVIGRHADLIVVHSCWSAEVVRHWLRPRGQVVVMPHGNYDGCYHPQRDAGPTRAAFGLRGDRPVLGVIGSVRPYRGHELAIEVAGQLPQVQLLIAGRASDAGYGQQIRTMAADHANVTCHLQSLDESAFAEAVQACDVVLLPYDDATTSGQLLAAWTLGRPVVTTDLPPFREFVTPAGDAGRIASANTAVGLAAAVRELLGVQDDRRRQAARAAADLYAWDRVVAPVVEQLRLCKPEAP
jgi:beta-1,4-mannosyltransferase